MNKINSKIFKCDRDCSFFRQLSMLSIFTVLSFSVSVASEQRREPAAVEEEVLTIPFEKEQPVMEYIFAEDDAGILKEMRGNVDAWEKTEEYAKVWNLESTGLYNTPETSDKGKYLAKRVMRYADKRFSGEMKKAEAGSTFYKVSKVEKQLRPNASVPVNKYIAIKFKARVLQGKAIVEVRNPWIDANATVSANGKAKILTKKDFKELGLSSGAEYSINDSEWVAYVDQAISANIKARVSSTQKNNDMMFSDDADARAEINASFPFNL